MTASSAPRGVLDLDDVEILDNHCHGLSLTQLLASDPAGLEARLTLTGQAYLTSNGSDEATWHRIEDLVEDNLYSIMSRRFLAAYLGCAGDRASVLAARDAAMRADPLGYLRGLLADARIVGLVADEGYTHLPVAGTEMAALTGLPVHRVVRVESFVDALKSEDLAGFDQFADALEGRLEEAAADPATIALKSVIAYRTGLDIGPEDVAAARASYPAWRASGWRDDRVHAKAVRDALAHRAMRVVERHDIALHIHCGDGDCDVVFQHSRPQDLYPFLTAYRRQPVVLMHAGHPWSEEACYLAAILPHVYVDLSVLVPWATTGIATYLEAMIATTPTRKLLYSSDQVYEPELFWLPARFCRLGLGRALGALVDRGDLGRGDAESIARGILHDNCVRLHAI